MAHHLGRAAHAHPTPAIPFLQEAVHAFARAALLESLGLRRRQGQLFPAARVGINDRHMAQAAATQETPPADRPACARPPVGGDFWAGGSIHRWKWELPGAIWRI
jgi:hypothetical protein